MPRYSPALIQQIRQQVRTLRRTLSPAERAREQHSVYQQIQHHNKIKQAQNIAIFRSFDGELDTQPIIEYLWQQNKAVYLPIISPYHINQLLFLRYEKQTELKPNKFGILEPILTDTNTLPFYQLDIVFTPLVAFDWCNYRIGMGGGFYDRLLENYQQKNIYPIGLAFKCQQIDHVPNQPWDIKLPEIIVSE